MPRISIDVPEELMGDIEKRAEKSYLSEKELVEDIVRRSMITWGKKSSVPSVKVDDKLVAVFSRDARGRKKKKK